MPQTHFIHFFIPPSEWGKRMKYWRYPKPPPGTADLSREKMVKYTHGNFSIRSAGYDGHTIYYLNARTDRKGYIILHNPQPFFGLVFSLRGRAKIELEESKSTSINDQSWFLIYMPGPRYIIQLAKGINDIILIMLTGQNVVDLRQLTGEYRLPDPYPPVNFRRKAWTLHHKFINKHLGEELKRLAGLKDEGYRSNLYVHHTVEGFVLQYSVHAGVEPPEDKTHPNFTQEAAQLAVNYIKQYFTEPGCGRLKEFARKFNVSERTMKTEFIKLTGMSLPEYVRDERMKLAEKLINEGMQSVGKVAETVGYTASSNFTRDYRLKYNITPGQHILNLQANQK